MAKWRIEELTGYKPKTDLYDLFTNGERLGPNGVISTTFKVAMDANRLGDINLKLFFDLAMVLCWKMHEHSVHDNDELRECYSKSLRMLTEKLEPVLTFKELSYLNNELARVANLPEEAFA